MCACRRRLLRLQKHGREFAAVLRIGFSTWGVAANRIFFFAACILRVALSVLHFSLCLHSFLRLLCFALFRVRSILRLASYALPLATYRLHLAARTLPLMAYLLRFPSCTLSRLLVLFDGVLCGLFYEHSPF